MDFSFAWPFLIPIVAVVGGCTVAIVATLARARVREAQIRERIAMIERGLVPPPEVDPGGFDRAIDEFDRRERLHFRRGPGRHRRSGIILMGVGFGLMVLIGFSSGEMSNGIGVGGFLVLLGVAFIVVSFFEEPRQTQWHPPAPPTSRNTPSSDPTTPNHL